jgi:hypothetical protein
MITASKIGLARICQHWATVEAKDEPGEAAKQGTATHKAIELKLNCHEPDLIILAEIYGADPFLLTQVYATWKTQWLDVRECYQVFPEQPFRWDGQTVSPIELTAPRAYPDDGAIYGTGDYMCLDGDGPLHMTDWKTGKWQSAQESHQARFLASCAAVVYARDVVFDLVFIGPDCVQISGLMITPEEGHRYLNDLWADLHRHTQAIPGAHCHEMYCPNRGKCEALKAMIEGKCTQPAPLEIDAAYVLEWDRLKKMTKAHMEAAEKASKALCDASGGQLALPDGRVFTAQVSNTTTLDRDALGKVVDLSEYQKTTEVTKYLVKKGK